jgi:hypothetical protein
MKNHKIEFIREQNKLTREQTIKLLSQTPNNLWYVTPKVLNSSIAWQVGHLIVS